MWKGLKGGQPSENLPVKILISDQKGVQTPDPPLRAYAGPYLSHDPCMYHMNNIFTLI